MRRFILFVLAWLLFSTTPAIASAPKPYFFPFVNPYAATVMETPPAYQAETPKDIPVKVFRVYPFPDRTMPDVFWYKDGLTCSLVKQKQKAPLIFLIAGTGARFNSPKMSNMQRAFYQAGFHVVSISSPTYSDFVVTASSSMMPGNLPEDAKDIYRVMQLAWEKVKGRVDVSTFYLTGYSLGGIQAAYVSKLDEQEQLFNFSKVLLINPPANLYNSVTRLDRMLVENVPGGVNNFNGFIQDLMRKFAEIREEMGYVELSSEYFHMVSKKYPPREDFLAALIGFSFRLDSSSMMFAADVMNGGGFVVPEGAKLNNSTSLTEYAMTYYRTGFADYFREYFLPFWQARKPGLTEQAMIDQLSLKGIEGYLGHSGKIGLLHNEDDVILARGEIEYLAELFGERAKIYPTGGHCGNMNHPDVVQYLTDFFSQEGSP